MISSPLNTLYILPSLARYSKASGIPVFLKGGIVIDEVNFLLPYKLQFIFSM